MKRATRTQRIYDPRLRQLVHTTGNVQLALDLGVPRSTARGWLRRAPREIVSIDALDHTAEDLRRELVALRRRVAKLRAFLRLAVAVLHAAGVSLRDVRLPEGAKKRLVLRAVGAARQVLPMRVVLRALGLSGRRYQAWMKADQECTLDDTTSCPQIVPHQLTADEVRTIQEMVTADEYRHVPTGTLAILAQRLGKVFASPSTWYRLVRDHGWCRPRQRVHPARPKVGIRASRPNEVWHVDTTMVRLLDGTRAYLHAVIDNFSRRILAWKVSAMFEPVATAEILSRAFDAIPSADRPTLLADGGVENFNNAVDVDADEKPRGICLAGRSWTFRGSRMVVGGVFGVRTRGPVPIVEV